MLRNLTRQLFVHRFFSTNNTMPNGGCYYAVTRGYTPGIYKSYSQVLEQITGFDHATFKKFDTYEAAYKHFFHTQHDEVIEKEKKTEEFVKRLKQAVANEKAAKAALASQDDSHDDVTKRKGENSPQKYCQILSSDIHPEDDAGDIINQTVLNMEDQSLFLKFEEDEPVVSEPVRKSARLEEKGPISFADEYTLADFERDLLEVASVCSEKVKSKGSNLKRPGRPRKIVAKVGECGEMFTKDGIPILYTDGCCTNVNLPEESRRAGCGVFWGEKDPRNITERLWGAQTNQRAELWAVIRGVQSALQSDYKFVEIRTDSRYVIEGMNTWIHKWKKNDWKTRSLQPVKNRELFVLLDNLFMYIDVNLVKVKGHSNDKGNDMADMLAKLGANLMPQDAPNFEPNKADEEDLDV